MGIALLILIPGTVLFLNYSKSTSDGVISNQFNLAGREISDNAEKMYVIGKGSWVTLEINLPDSFREAGIMENKEFYFTYATSGGESQAVFFVDKFNISNGVGSCAVSCDLGFTPGINFVRIESDGSSVFIKKMS